MTSGTKKLTIREMTYIALSAALISVSAWIAIPMTIPFTLQTFAVVTVAGLLGFKKGLAATVVYILLGAVGLPVFSGFNAGLGALMGATGGYIIGFLFLAVCVGYASDKWNTRPLFLVLSSILGLVLCYGFGTAWFMYVYARSTGPVGLATALSWCVVPYIIPDIIKIAAAVFIITRLKPIIKAS